MSAGKATSARSGADTRVLRVQHVRTHDLDLDRPEDEEEWERRVMALAAARIIAERARLERLGVIDASEGCSIDHQRRPGLLLVPLAEACCHTATVAHFLGSLQL